MVQCPVMNWISWTAIIIGSLIPILVWLFFFCRKNPEKLTSVILTFTAGMIAVIPIKVLESNWDRAILWMENVNFIEHLEQLAHIPNLAHFLAFISVSIAVSLLLFLFTFSLMFVLEVFSGDDSIKIFSRKTARISETPFFFISIGFLIGLCGFFLSESVPHIAWFLITVGMLEEYVKHLVVRFSDEFQIRCVDDAIQFSIIVALGFAWVENVLYFERIWSNGLVDGFGAMFLVFLLRSTLSVGAHVCFSAIFGYFYGIAHFSSEFFKVVCQENRCRVTRIAHKILHLQNETLFHNEKMMEGMIVAMVAHTIFNGLLEAGQVPLAIVFTVVMMLTVLHLYHRFYFYKNNGNLYNGRKHLTT